MFGAILAALTMRWGQRFWLVAIVLIVEIIGTGQVLPIMTLLRLTEVSTLPGGGTGISSGQIFQFKQWQDIVWVIGYNLVFVGSFIALVLGYEAKSGDRG